MIFLKLCIELCPMKGSCSCAGIESGGSGEVHGGCGICQVNDGGVRLMDCAAGDVYLLLENHQPPQNVKVS